MVKLLRLILVIVTTVSMAFTPLVFMGTASAASAGSFEACNSIGGSWGSNGCTVSNQPSLNTVLIGLIQTLSIIAGIAAVIMIIIAGFRFMTSNGDSNTVASARRTLIYALVGLVVVAASQAIVKFVLQKVK